MTAAAEAPKVDGRSLRSERSRRAAVEAVLDLLDGGVERPTAQQVADRSGLSLSTIFRLYDDLESLHTAAVAAQAERVAPLLVELDDQGPLVDRIDALVAARARLYEAITPVRRFVRRQDDRSPTLSDHRARFDADLRAQALEVLSPELVDAGPWVPDVVDALTSWDLWERLRTVQGRSADDARSVVAAGLERSLAAPAD